MSFGEGVICFLFIEVDLDSEFDHLFNLSNWLARRLKVRPRSSLDLLDELGVVSPLPLDSLSNFSSFFLNTGKKSTLALEGEVLVSNPTLSPFGVLFSTSGAAPVTGCDSELLEALALDSSAVTAEAKSVGGDRGGSAGARLVGRICSH